MVYNQMVYKRAGREAGAIAPKLNLRNLIALQQSQATAPQTVAWIVSNILLFVAGYIVFQRQEVRA
jgi:hypothetical protein